MARGRGKRDGFDRVHDFIFWFTVFCTIAALFLMPICMVLWDQQHK